MVLPALRALGLERHRSVAAAHPRVLPLYRASGLFTRVLPARGSRAPWELAGPLKEFGPERALIFTRAVSGALLARLSGARLRMGRTGFLHRTLYTNPLPVDRERRRLWREYLELSLAAGGAFPGRPDFTLPLEPAARTRADTLLENLSRPVALAPGAAYGPAKRWDPQRFGDLARRLRERGTDVVVVGGESERALGRELSDAGAVDLTGKTGLLDAVAVLSRCSVLVSNDSGALHLSRAAGTPVVGLFGSSSPEWTGPEPEEGTVIWLGLSCSPCFKRTCPLEGDRHLACLRGIEVDTVLERVLAAGNIR